MAFEVPQNLAALLCGFPPDLEAPILVKSFLIVSRVGLSGALFHFLGVGLDLL